MIIHLKQGDQWVSSHCLSQATWKIINGLEALCKQLTSLY